jgi:fatty acid-binding protein DegV
MATIEEVRQACKLADDNDDLDAALAQLAGIYAGTGDLQLIIARDGYQISIERLKARLENQGDEFDTMIGQITTAILTAIGADETVVGSIQEALANLKASNDAAIAGT